jgi:hypothetical protein
MIKIINHRLYPTGAPSNNDQGIALYNKCLGIFLKCFGIATTYKCEGRTYYVNKKSLNKHSTPPPTPIPTPQKPIITTSKPITTPPIQVSPPIEPKPVTPSTQVVVSPVFPKPVTTPLVQETKIPLPPQHQKNSYDICTELDKQLVEIEKRLNSDRPNTSSIKNNLLQARKSLEEIHQEATQLKAQNKDSKNLLSHVQRVMENLETTEHLATLLLKVWLDLETGKRWAIIWTFKLLETESPCNFSIKLQLKFQK